MDNLIDLNCYCRKCKREIPEGAIYFMHPKIGPVCEFCPEFNDGDIKIQSHTPEGEEEKE
jgi:hypothetical protein